MSVFLLQILVQCIIVIDFHGVLVDDIRVGRVDTGNVTYARIYGVIEFKSNHFMSTDFWHIV